MGKNKAQRTKNNARPSSSGRSAQLLETSGFVGFPTLAEGGLSLPAFAGLTGLQLDEGESSNINPQLMLVLKKMNKKDAITRLKALQEFAEVCASIEDEELQAVLRCWPGMFGVLATDPDHRVREATQRAHHQLTKKAGRNIAPHLRSLSGPWFVSQFDTFAPAASEASQSLQDSFPGNKLPEAIKYCQKEILSYITDNILSQTVETVAYEKSLSTDELEARMERVLSSNLQGYHMYLQHLPASELKQAIDVNKKLVSSPKFWKISKHKSPLVRRAWYIAVAALLHEAPFLVEGMSAQLAPALFGNLDEADPSVLPAVWEATLHALMAIEDCWSHVNCEKMVFPKLWLILREGGQGNAAAIFPNLLPLLSKIAPQDKYTFYSKFFSNLKAGLSQKSVLQSSSESSAVATAYIECFRYISVKEDDTDLLQRLMTEQVLPLIESCTTERKFHQTLNPLASQILRTLQLWKTRNESNLQTLFWNNMTSVCGALTESQNPEDSFLSFSEFVLLLWNPAKIKKNRKVNFSTDENTTNEEASGDISSISTLEDSKDLASLGHQLAKQDISMVENSKHPEAYINILVKLAKAFQSQEFFNSLKGSCVAFFNESLHPWILNSDITAKPVIELIFLLLKYLEPSHKTDALASISKLESRASLLQCFEESVVIGKQGDQEILTWLKSPEIHNLLLDLTKEVSNVSSTYSKDQLTAWNILKLFFSATINEDLFISLDTVSEILQVFCEAFTQYSEKPKDDSAIESCANFIGELSISFSQQLKLCQVPLQELLLVTFKLCCGKMELSKTARESLQRTWKNGINYLDLSKSEMQKLCETISKFAHENFTLMNNQSVICSAQFISVLKDATISQVFLQLPPKFSTWQKQLENVVIVTDIVNNNVYGLKDKSIPVVTNFDSLYNYINSVLFNVTLLQELLTIVLEEQEESSALPSDFIVDKIIEAVFALAVCQKIVSDYKNNQTCYKLQIDVDTLKETLTSVMSKVSIDDIELIILHILEQMKRDYHQWMWTLPTLIQVASKWETQITDILQRELLLAINSSWCTWNIWLLQAVPVLCKHELVLRLLSTKAVECLTADDDTCAIYLLFLEKSISDDEFKKMFDLFLARRQRGEWNSVFKNEQLESSKFHSWIKVLAYSVKSRPWVLTPRHWDSLLCSLTSWFQEGRECVLQQPTNCKFASHLNSLCFLQCMIQSHINKMTDDNELQAIGPKHLIEEWNSLFVPELYSILMTFFYSAIENQMPSIWEHFKLQMIGLCLMRTPVKWFVTHEPPKHLTKNFKRLTIQDRNTENLCRILCSQLHSAERVIQVIAFHLFSRLVPELVEKDEAYRLSEDNDSLDTDKLSCVLLGMELSATHSVVETMLMDFRVGDCCIVEPFTDSHFYTQSYLLTWGVLLDLCKTAKSELRYFYARWFSNAGYTNTMLDVVFRLMPDYVVHQFESKASSSITPSSRSRNMFLQEYYPSLTGYHTASGIQQAACWIYKRSLLHLPALVRAWWNESETSVAGLVERLTSTLVSPLVCAIEMKAVHDHEKNFSNMVVKVHQQVREVVAVYTIDEVCMELTISLPANHPLGPVRVEGNKPAIDISKWKQWVMQLTIFLTHQNGSIWDGLMLWKRNLDTKFAGVEECYICYSVLHGTSYQIPKLSCHTCHKKFHSSCLYRWFHTSNNSTCPICRNLF